MNKNVFQKLQLARLILQEKKLSKSGKNKFAGYEYFELQDFLPSVQTIFADTGLCAVFRCGADTATLTVYNIDNPGESIDFTAPMAAAELKGCHPVQNLGASISYLRRYLYVNALEIVEHDALDATTGQPPKAEPKPAPKAAPQMETKPVGQTESGATVAQAKNVPSEWGIQIQGSPSDAAWYEALEASCDYLLGLAANKADVVNIFKRNKDLFDTAKTNDEAFFKTIMAKFTEAKSNLPEA
jgi:hypothetical protein